MVEMDPDLRRRMLAYYDERASEYEEAYTRGTGTASIKDTVPVDLNRVVPADSPRFLISPGGITNAGEIAATALSLHTFEVHAVVASRIRGTGPAARGATKPPPVLSAAVRALLARPRTPLNLQTP